MRNFLVSDPEIKELFAKMPAIAGPETPIREVQRLGNRSPLRELLAIGLGEKGPRQNWELRARCLAWAAPYIHPRQPQAIHVTGDVRVAAVSVRIVGAPQPPALPPAHEGQDGAWDGA